MGFLKSWGAFIDVSQYVIHKGSIIHYIYIYIYIHTYLSKNQYIYDIYTYIYSTYYSNVVTALMQLGFLRWRASLLTIYDLAKSFKPSGGARMIDKNG